MTMVLRIYLSLDLFIINLTRFYCFDLWGLSRGLRLCDSLSQVRVLGITSLRTCPILLRLRFGRVDSLVYRMLGMEPLPSFQNWILFSVIFCTQDHLCHFRCVCNHARPNRKAWSDRLDEWVFFARACFESETSIFNFRFTVTGQLSKCLTVYRFYEYPRVARTLGLVHGSRIP